MRPILQYAQEPEPRPDGGPVPTVMKGHTDAVLGCGFSPDGQLICSGGKDKYIRIFHADGGQLEQSVLLHEDDVNSVMYSPCGKYLVSASKDKVCLCAGHFA